MEVSMDFIKPYYDDNDVAAVYKTLQPREVIVDLPPEVSEVVKQWAIADAVTMLEPWLDKLNAVGSPDSLSLYRDIEKMMFEEPDKAYHGVCAARQWLDDYERERREAEEELRKAEERRNDEYRRTIDSYKEIAEHELAMERGSGFITMEGLQGYAKVSGLSDAAEYVEMAKERLRESLMDEIEELHVKAMMRPWRRNASRPILEGRGHSLRGDLYRFDLCDLMRFYEDDKAFCGREDEREAKEAKDKRLIDLRASVVELALKVDPCLLRPTVVDAFDKIDDESVLQSDIDRYAKELERREVPMNGS